jgi:hypothetical protein
MTCIAFDGNTLAADRRVTDQCDLHRTTTKIVQIGDTLLGIEGRECVGLEMREWYANGCIPADFPALAREEKASLIVIRQRKILVFQTSPIAVEVREEFWAWGSGRDYAIAAMALGRTAKEAVELAAHFITSVGDGVDVLLAPPTEQG